MRVLQFDWCFKAFKNNSMLISINFAFSLSDLSTFFSCSNSFYVKIMFNFKSDLVSFISSSLCLSSLSSRLHASFSSFIIASDSEFVIKKIMIVSCNLSLNSTQSQMFLEFEEYVEKKLHFLILDIQDK